MSNPTRIVIFGTSSGLVWSLAPGLLGGLFFDSLIPLPLMLVTCALIGVFVSLLLALPMLKRRHWSIALPLGVVALPIAGFLFGLFFSLFQNSGESPLRIGLSFAFYALGPLFAIILVPCSVLTTLLLRKCLLTS